MKLSVVKIFADSIPNIFSTKKNSSLSFLLYTLFDGLVSEEDCCAAVELTFYLLVPRLQYHEAVSTWQEANPQQSATKALAHAKEEKEALLYAFLEAQYREQIERNKKGKETIEQFNERFKQFIDKLSGEEIGVLRFDAGTPIFEPMTTDRDGCKTSIDGAYDPYAEDQKHLSSMTKQLTEVWEKAADELVSIAASKLCSKGRGNNILGAFFDTFFASLKTKT